MRNEDGSVRTYGGKPGLLWIAIALLFAIVVLGTAAYVAWAGPLEVFDLDPPIEHNQT